MQVRKIEDIWRQVRKVRPVILGIQNLDKWDK